MNKNKTTFLSVFLYTLKYYFALMIGAFLGFIVMFGVVLGIREMGLINFALTHLVVIIFSSFLGYLVEKSK